MREEVSSKKGSSIELTPKGKIVGAILIIVVIAVVVGILLVNNKSAEFNLEITSVVDKEDMSSMAISPGVNTSMELKSDADVKLVYMDNDNNYGVNWIVSDESIAKVEGDKLVRLKSGSVSVYAVSKKNSKVTSNTLHFTFE